MRETQRTLEDFFTVQMSELLPVWAVVTCFLDFVFLLVEPWYFDGGCLLGYILFRLVAFVGSLAIAIWVSQPSKSRVRQLEALFGHNRESRSA